MTTNYHDPITDSTVLDTSGLGQRFSDLDAQLTKSANGAMFGTLSTLGIISGAVTQTTGRHVLAAESGTADIVTTITPITGAQFLLLKADAGDTIILESGPGNLELGRDLVLSGETYAMLYYDGADWRLFSTNQPASVPYQYVYGFENQISSDTLIDISPGECAGVLNGVHIKNTAQGQLNMAASGVNGIDTGVVAINTSYILYVVIGGSGIGYVASTNVTTPTLPAGYNWDYRRIGSVRTDGSGFLYRQRMTPGGLGSRVVRFTSVPKSAPFLIANDVNLGNGSGGATTMDFSALTTLYTTHVIALIGVNTASAAVDIFWYLNSLSIFLGSMTTVHAYWAEHVLPISGGSAAAYGDADDEDFSVIMLGYIENIGTDTP